MTQQNINLIQSILNEISKHIYTGKLADLGLSFGRGGIHYGTMKEQFLTRKIDIKPIDGMICNYTLKNKK